MKEETIVQLTKSTIRGRPRILRDRRNILLPIGVDLLKAIDDSRGEVPRTVYIRSVLREHHRRNQTNEVL